MTIYTAHHHLFYLYL